MKEDPDRETLARLLNTWYSVFGMTPAMIREAIKRGSEHNDESIELREVLRDIADERGEINRKNWDGGSEGTPDVLLMESDSSAPAATAQLRHGRSRS